MTFWMTLAGAVGLCLETGITFRLQENFFPHRKNRYIAVLSGMILYLTVMAGFGHINLPVNYLLYSIMRQSFLILLLILFFRGSLWNRASAASILCASLEFAVNTVAETLSLIDMFLPVKQQIFSDLFIYLSYPAAIVILWLTFRHIRLHPNIFSEQTCRLLFFIMCGLILLTDIVYHGITHGVIMISYVGYPEVFDSYTSELLTHTECIILSVLSLAMTLCLPAGLSRIIQQAVSEQIHNTQIVHYQSLIEEYKRQAGLRHDLHNHLLVLKRLTKQGELDKISGYLDTMCRETYPATETIHTGNMIADAVIDIKAQAARTEDISFACELHLPKNLPLEDFDLCILLGNLLDNAIQAASRIPEAKSRAIVMRAEIVRRNLLLEIKNTVADDTKLRHFGSANYGTGLHNVRNIIEKHNGLMDINLETSLFCVSILLPFKPRP